MRPYMPQQPVVSGGFSIGLMGWAAAMLSAAACVFLASQVHINLLEKDRLQQSSDEARQRLATIVATVRESEAVLQKRETHLKKLEAAANRQKTFLSDLVELSRTDLDARTIVHRWKVTSEGGMEAPSAQSLPIPTSRSAPLSQSKAAADVNAFKPKPAPAGH